MSKKESKKRQFADEVIGPVYKAVVAGTKPKKENWEDLSWKSVVVNGVLMRKTAKYMYFHHTIIIWSLYNCTSEWHIWVMKEW